MADLTITAASVVNSSCQVGHALAGETITAGQVVYLNATDGKVYKAQCDGTTAEANAVGVALNGGAAGQWIAYGNNGTLVIGATTVKTTTYVLSAAAGGIAPQADLVSTNKVVRIGHATDVAGTLVVNIQNTGAVV
jgi:predicted transcriptional regulator